MACTKFTVRITPKDFIAMHGFNAAHKALEYRRQADAEGDWQDAKGWQWIANECERLYGLDMPKDGPRNQMKRNPFR